MVSSVPGVDVDPAIAAAIHRAAKLLEGAGYRVEEVAPPDLREAGVMFWTIIMTEERAASAEEKGSSTRAIELYGDEAVKRTRAGNKAYAGEFDFDAYIKALARRTTILRKWRFFLKRYPLVLMPVSASFLSRSTTIKGETRRCVVSTRRGSRCLLFRRSVCRALRFPPVLPKASRSAFSLWLIASKKKSASLRVK